MRGTVFYGIALLCHRRHLVRRLRWSDDGLRPIHRLALGAIGVDALMQSVVLMAMGVTTASAAAWLAWTTVRHDYRAPVSMRRAAPALDMA